jgi:phospholipid/cholesterol/gamma-HCH transport system substrate-binding protein
MDRDANYVVVGAFVLLVVAMAASFVFWYTDQRDKRTYQPYEIYFQGTVSGLTAGSPVRYLGVDVGKVERILLDSGQPKRVEVIAQIEAGAPIDGRTLASLNLQGVTGLLYINLEQDANAASAGALAPGRRYPIIRSARSDFDVLMSSLPALATHTIELVDHFDQAFNEQNVKALGAALDNLRRASEGLPQTVQEMRGLVEDMRNASHEVEGAARDLRTLTAESAPDFKTALVNVRELSTNLTHTSDQLQQSLPEFERLLHGATDATRDFRDLSRSLKQNPSQLLFEPNETGLELPR